MEAGAETEPVRVVSEVPPAWDPPAVVGVEECLEGAAADAVDS